jgi:cystathionine gamma-synthase
VQLGWLYLDSIDIIKKRSDENFLFVNIHQKEQFENWLAENHQKVANIISETVSNPILQCLDLPWLSSLCKKYEIGLILDHTMASPFCAEALPYCDIAVESLTKFACGNANILMGAVMVNENSPYQDQIKSEIEKYTLKPYLLDCQRLAFEMQEYEVRMQKISKNVSQVYDYLKTQDFVEKIYSVYEENSWQNFQKIRKNNNHIGLITVIFKKPLAQCYDALNFSKGPSLGTEFTLAMPYTYLAHYDLLQTEEGKKFLEEAGLDARIIRISVGIEPIEDIINEFEKIKRM